MIQTLIRCEAVTRAVINRWWRPACAVGFVASLWTQGVWVTLAMGQRADLVGLAAVITAITAAMGVRELGKRWGTAQ